MHNGPPEIDPNHKATQGVLRGLGLTLAATGMILTVVGLVSFFRAFGTGQFPQFFWCVIVGLPLLGLGFSISQLGYLRTIGRYVAGEVVPVQKDVFNSMAAGTAPGVEALARAAARGFTAPTRGVEVVPCPHCQAPNDETSRFCAQCGASLESRRCAGCGHPAAPGANFCGHCGARLKGDRL